jgi:hypothetical protein
VQGNYRGHLSARGGSVQLLNDYDRPIATLGYPAPPSLAQQFLRVTELMYHPASPLAGSTNTDEDFEFIELRNTSAVDSLDLAGVRFIDGIEFNFITVPSRISPRRARAGRGQLIRVHQSLRCGPPMAGQFFGQLDHGGERIHLVDGRGEDILDFTYDDDWQPLTDGNGFSLVIRDDLAPWDTWGVGASWRASGELDGSPGATDPAPLSIAPIRVNEVLSASVPAGTDAIELFNPATTNVTSAAGG